MANDGSSTMSSEQSLTINFLTIPVLKGGPRSDIHATVEVLARHLNSEQ